MQPLILLDTNILLYFLAGKLFTVDKISLINPREIIVATKK